jgi:hypothetical protein
MLFEILTPLELFASDLSISARRWQSTLRVAQQVEIIDLDSPLPLTSDRAPGLHYDGSSIRPIRISRADPLDLCISGMAKTARRCVRRTHLATRR